eukprot:gene56636-biopygen64314
MPRLVRTRCSSAAVHARMHLHCWAQRSAHCAGHSAVRAAERPAGCFGKSGCARGICLGALRSVQQPVLWGVLTGRSLARGGRGRGGACGTQLGAPGENILHQRLRDVLRNAMFGKEGTAPHAYHQSRVADSLHAAGGVDAVQGGVLDELTCHTVPADIRELLTAYNSAVAGTLEGGGERTSLMIDMAILVRRAKGAYCEAGGLGWLDSGHLTPTARSQPRQGDSIRLGRSTGILPEATERYHQACRGKLGETPPAAAVDASEGGEGELGWTYETGEPVPPKRPRGRPTGSSKRLKLLRELESIQKDTLQLRATDELTTAAWARHCATVGALALHEAALLGQIPVRPPFRGDAVQHTTYLSACLHLLAADATLVQSIGELGNAGKLVLREAPAASALADVLKVQLEGHTSWAEISHQPVRGVHWLRGPGPHTMEVDPRIFLLWLLRRVTGEIRQCGIPSSHALQVREVCSCGVCGHEHDSVVDVSTDRAQDPAVAYSIGAVLYQGTRYWPAGDLRMRLGKCAVMLHGLLDTFARTAARSAFRIFLLERLNVLAVPGGLDATAGADAQPLPEAVRLLLREHVLSEAHWTCLRAKYMETYGDVRSLCCLLCQHLRAAGLKDGCIAVIAAVGAQWDERCAPREDPAELRVPPGHSTARFHALVPGIRVGGTPRWLHMGAGGMPPHGVDAVEMRDFVADQVSIPPGAIATHVDWGGSYVFLLRRQEHLGPAAADVGLNNLGHTVVEVPEHCAAAGATGFTFSDPGMVQYAEYAERYEAALGTQGHRPLLLHPSRLVTAPQWTLPAAGVYRVTAPHVLVGVAPTLDSRDLGQLGQGAVVRIEQCVHLVAEWCVRGELAAPALAGEHACGWVSMRNLRTGYEWLQKCSGETCQLSGAAVAVPIEEPAGLAADADPRDTAGNIDAIRSNIAYKLQRWPCREPGCTGGYKRKDKLEEHVTQVHGYSGERFVPLYPAEARAAKQRFADALELVDVRICRVCGIAAFKSMGAPSLDKPEQTRLQPMELTWSACKLLSFEQWKAWCARIVDPFDEDSKITLAWAERCEEVVRPYLHHCHTRVTASKQPLQKCGYELCSIEDGDSLHAWDLMLWTIELQFLLYRILSAVSFRLPPLYCYRDWPLRSLARWGIGW